MLTRKDLLAVRNLDRKIFDVNEAPHVYGRSEDVNDVLTALLREARLCVTHEGVSGGQKTFLLEPYTLFVYKKGLYVVGRSLYHDSIRTFAMDGFRALEWRKGDRFEYPPDYWPDQLTEGAFGLFRGDLTHVRIHFDAEVARYVRRRRWHPTQRFCRTNAGAVELTVDVHGTVEIVSWVLGFDSKAKVLEPEELRLAVARELKKASASYQPDAVIG